MVEIHNLQVHLLTSTYLHHNITLTLTYPPNHSAHKATHNSLHVHTTVSINSQLYFNLLHRCSSRNYYWTNPYICSLYCRLVLNSMIGIQWSCITKSTKLAWAQHLHMYNTGRVKFLPVTWHTVIWKSPFAVIRLP
jgi:hypothetical protein